MSGTIANGKWNPCCVACTMAAEAHQERCACQAHCHTGQEHPVLALDPCWLLCSTQESPCAPHLPQPHDHDTQSHGHATPSHINPCPRAPHPTATGLPNWLLALECNISFPLGQEPKQICSCVSWRSSDPPTTAFVQEQSPVTMSEYT